MPYSKDNPPEAIKKLPAHARDIFLEAFNNAWKQYADREDREALCFKIGWSAVKKVYKKNADDKWVKKS